MNKIENFHVKEYDNTLFYCSQNIKFVAFIDPEKEEQFYIKIENLFLNAFKK